MTESTLGGRSGTLPKPGWLGRILRLAIGLLQINFVVSVVPHAERLASGAPVENTFYWVAVGAAFWLLPPVLDIGFSRSWGRKSQMVVIALALLAAAAGLLLFGRLWSPLLASLLFALAVYIHTHLGLSHILSAILATPGCEMRAVPHLAALIRGGDGNAQACPGMWDGFDRWESNLTRQSSRGIT